MNRDEEGPEAPRDGGADDQATDDRPAGAVPTPPPAAQRRPAHPLPGPRTPWDEAEVEPARWPPGPVSPTGPTAPSPGGRPAPDPASDQAPAGHTGAAPPAPPPPSPSATTQPPTARTSGPTANADETADAPGRSGTSSGLHPAAEPADREPADRDPLPARSPPDDTTLDAAAPTLPTTPDFEAAGSWRREEPGEPDPDPVPSPPPRPGLRPQPTPPPRSEGPQPAPRPGPHASPVPGVHAPVPPPRLPETPEEPEERDLADDALFADLAAGLEARGEEDERSYSEIVRRVDAYRAQGYDLFGIAGYPSTGKTHAVKALIHRLHGFDPTARAELRRGRAPGPTEYWPFYYAYDGARGGRWVLMDTSGDLYAQIHDNQWVEHLEAKGGLLNTIRHASGLLLLVHLTRGHLDLAAAGFSDEMDEDETAREETAQRAQEEIDFLDHLLLFSRALRAERGEIAHLVRGAADARDLDDALRRYRDSPKLDVPVAVLFTQADRLAGGRDFAVAPGRYLAPANLIGVAPFVARHLPTLFTTLLRHVRRFRFDFMQSYVERPSPGGGVPLWSWGDEPLSIGLVPALEFLQRRGPTGRRPSLGRFEVDTRTTLRLHRLFHPRLWEGVEIDL